MWAGGRVKLGLDGLALAFETSGRAKANVGPSPMARLGPAYLGLAQPSPWPEARPGTALVLITLFTIKTCSYTLKSLKLLLEYIF